MLLTYYKSTGWINATTYGSFWLVFIVNSLFWPVIYGQQVDLNFWLSLIVKASRTPYLIVRSEL